MKKNTLINITHFLGILFILVMLVIINWLHIKNEYGDVALRIAKMGESTLLKSDIKVLDETSDDLNKPQYQNLKKSLSAIIRINPKARFAYVLTQKNNKIYFNADSEPVESMDYSPPGQEYTEASDVDKQPFIDGECHVTKPHKDRWGKWITIYIPIKDDKTHEILAVFGMDYNSAFWQGNLMIYLINLSATIIFLMIVLTLLLIRRSYKSLKDDNTELIETQLALKESEEKYRTITHSTLDIIFVIDKFGNQLFFNESVERVLGYKVEELIGKSFVEFVPINELPKYLVHLNDVFSNKEIRNFITKIIHKDGHLVDVEINGKVVRQNGELVGEGTIVDITMRLKAEQEIKDKNNELRILNSEKDKFFSILAHDLRSPLNGLLGLSEYMVDEVLTLPTTDIQKYLRELSKSTKSLYTLIENLLDWARSQQGLMPFVPEKVGLYQSANDVIDLSSKIAANKSISLTNRIPVNLLVFVDKNMLQTVLRNLISNAIKFTPRGGEVLISARKTKNFGIEIAVKDSGIGMNAELLKNLFKLHFNEYRKGTENEPSSGLGLMLCKEFIEKNGGEIWVESKEKFGTTIFFTLQGNLVK